MKPEVYHYILVDVFQRRMYPARIEVQEGIIRGITESNETCKHFALPGFIDAHVHIESSMLIPSEFARMAVRRGTVATVSDPHEIANVCGIEGVEYMLNNAKKVPFKFHFGAPSCVPATAFETAGAVIDAEGVRQLLQRDDIYYLSEMMNYPGVLFRDPEVMKKIAIAQQIGKPVDGHAPGLRGNDAATYIAAGISTDHECVTCDEAKEKLELGMKILIREGSAAKNFEALIPLLSEYPESIMFCCDDKHPDELELHHINRHVTRSLQKGHSLFNVLQAACVNPVLHYKLPVGLLRVGDPADFIVCRDLENMEVLSTFIDGIRVYHEGACSIKSIHETSINFFECSSKIPNDFALAAASSQVRIRVIEALEGQLITRTLEQDALVEDGYLLSDTTRDNLKLCVVNRYANEKPALGFIRNFNLQRGAIASTVAHDSHNIVAVGCSDAEICRAVNALIASGGGIAVADGDEVLHMALPVAGLMSHKPAEEVTQLYKNIDARARALGSTLQAPFMTLSFMALLVIPQLKLSDKGLFDGGKFCFTNVVIEEQGVTPL